MSYLVGTANSNSGKWFWNAILPYGNIGYDSFGKLREIVVPEIPVLSKDTNLNY